MLRTAPSSRMTKAGSLEGLGERTYTCSSTSLASRLWKALWSSRPFLLSHLARLGTTNLVVPLCPVPDENPRQQVPHLQLHAQDHLLNRSHGSAPKAQFTKTADSTAGFPHHGPLCPSTVPPSFLVPWQSSPGPSCGQNPQILCWSLL
jgi:hypothetical protein